MKMYKFVYLLKYFIRFDFLIFLNVHVYKQIKNFMTFKMAKHNVKTEEPGHRTHKTLKEKSNNINTETKFLFNMKEREE